MLAMAESIPPAAPPPPSTPHRHWARTVIWVVMIVALSVNAFIFVKSCRDLPGDTLARTGEVIDKAGSALSSIAAAFKQGTITTSFVSYATSVTNHQRLQVATLKEMAVFTQTNQMSTAFGYIPLPEVVVEARAPVEYTYYLDLNDSWRFVLQEGVIHALAPRLQFNKPAVDVSAINYEVRKGSFKTGEALEGLKRSVSSLVILRARENTGLVRETARRETAAFVEKWLRRSFSDAQAYPVQVHFEGETAPAGVRVPAFELVTNAPPR